MIDLPENELLIRAQIGDVDDPERRQAENELVGRFEGVAHSSAHLASRGRPDLFDDSCQAARIGIWKATQKWKLGGSSVGTYAVWWARGYARNEAYKAPVLYSAGTGPDVECTRPTPEAAVSNEDLAERMRAILATCTELDALDRTVISERLLGQCKTLAQIALAFDVSVTTVANRERRLVAAVLPRIFASLRESL